jgi:elongator complex protein 1
MLINSPVLTEKAETRSLLPHLLQFTAEHREEGLGLQNEVEAFEVELKESVEEIWTRPVVDEENGVGASVPDSWASRMAEVEKDRVVNPLDKVAKPDLFQRSDWRVKGLFGP